MRSTIILAVLLVILSAWKAFANPPGECKQGFDRIVTEQDGITVIHCEQKSEKKRYVCKFKGIELVCQWKPVAQDQ